MYGIPWMDREEEYKTAYSDLDKFFEDLHNNEYQNIDGVTIAYREAQQRFASTVMEAIRDKKILLIQAGVGTGKSFGYLIPIFYTMKNVTLFDKVVISTSSIALQEQLMHDIDEVSKLLNYKIKSWVSKGMNNYACIKRIEDKILSAENHNDNETLETLNALKKAMRQSYTCDKTHLPSVGAELWNGIKVCGKCGKCSYSKDCLFISDQIHIRNMPIIVTNHAQFSNMLKCSDSVITSASLIIVDEAHKLEEHIRLTNQTSINFNDIIAKLKEVEISLKWSEKYDASYELNLLALLNKSFSSELLDLAKAIRSSVRRTFSKQAQTEHLSIDECDKLSFNPNNRQIQETLDKIIISLTRINKILKPIPEIKSLTKNREFFRDLLLIFKDLKKEKDSKYVYWANFITDERIELIYSEKDFSEYYDKIFDYGKPVVLTSATMSTNGEYDHFAASLGLENNENVISEYAIDSPFDYENNSLFYYDDTMIKPNDKDRNKYIRELAIRICELIEITEGKALILFTSKSDMKSVYNIVKYMLHKYNLILQEDKDVNKYKDAFEEDENSCLFATGAFWEGVDFPGKTLSNLIVVRLPFPVQDPIIEFKKSTFTKEASHEVDLNEMLMKLSQGTGRLIRKMSDTGVVCCLDSRTSHYLEAIKKSLPFKRYTNDLNELIAFSESKIIGKEKGNAFVMKPIDQK